MLRTKGLPTKKKKKKENIHFWKIIRYTHPNIIRKNLRMGCHKPFRLQRSLHFSFSYQTRSLNFSIETMVSEWKERVAELTWDEWISEPGSPTDWLCRTRNTSLDQNWCPKPGETWLMVLALTFWGCQSLTSARFGKVLWEGWNLGGKR